MHDPGLTLPMARTDGATHAGCGPPSSVQRGPIPLINTVVSTARTNVPVSACGPSLRKEAVRPVCGRAILPEILQRHNYEIRQLDRRIFGQA